MKDLDRAKTLANSNEQYLAEWIEKARTVTELLPQVQQIHETVKWQRDTLYSLIDTATELGSGMIMGLERERTVFETYLPTIGNVDGGFTGVSSMTANAIAGASQTFIYLNNIAPTLTEDNQLVINQRIDSYVLLREKQTRLEQVRALLANLDSQLIDELGTAETEVRRYKAGACSVIVPATVIRNVLQHFKGQVLLRARHSEKDTVNWGDMVKRLTPSRSAADRATLEDEGKKHNLLYDKLSTILKGNSQSDVPGMENIFIQITDHFYTVLTLVEF